MRAAEQRGEVPKGTADKWEKHTKKKKLPEYAEHEKKAAAALDNVGLPKSTHDQLLAQLVLIQHHIDDAEVYGGTGHQDAANLSLDDAEEGVENIAEKVLPPSKTEVVEGVAEEGDKEEEEAGIEEEGLDSEKEAHANDAFEIGMRYTFHKQGFDNARIEALVDVAKGMAQGSVKTAADIHEVMVPHVLAAQYTKTAALAALAAPVVGAGVGAFRKKDPGEGRLKAILRSALTGGATGIGMLGGAVAGGLAGLAGGPAAGITVPVGAILGQIGGGLGAYHLAKRKPQDDKKDDKKDGDEKSKSDDKSSDKLKE
jgi:hypothetical protein